MTELRTWLRTQTISVRELAKLLGVPLTTVEDWVYKDAVPSRANAERLNDFIARNCAHHWVIDRANGPMSDGVCQRCGERRQFTNSAEPSSMWATSHRPKAK